MRRRGRAVPAVIAAAATCLSRRYRDDRQKEKRSTAAPAKILRISSLFLFLIISYSFSSSYFFSRGSFLLLFFSSVLNGLFLSFFFRR
ncbi:unnamed protein product [Cuscuta epithymum]|uniref:Secreted protein n=1 Tax=Cuscuta epithymum TaxID=186058 RepID=A0AAV0F8T1_9ASTE|nr:unnamed protein product [Cuscuta epithymum]